jgi:hypothetical protein
MFVNNLGRGLPTSTHYWCTSCFTSFTSWNIGLRDRADKNIKDKEVVSVTDPELIKFLKKLHPHLSIEKVS